MLDLYDKIQDASKAIQDKWGEKPHAGIILGTGLGHLVEQIDVAATLDYDTIPHFLKSTATSHRGRLVCGKLEGVPTVVMEGRFHMYEGYSLKDVTLPVRIFKALGSRTADRVERRRGDEPVLQPGRPDGDRRSHQPDGRQPARRHQ